MILKSVEPLLQENPDWGLVIIGKTDDKEYAGEILSLAAKNNIASQVHLVSETRDIAGIYRAAGVVVIASSTEGFSLVCLEAPSCGIITVATEGVGVHSEVLTHGKNGFLFPPGDEEALRKILADIINGKVSPDPSVIRKNIIDNWDLEKSVAGVAKSIRYSQLPGICNSRGLNFYKYPGIANSRVASYLKSELSGICNSRELRLPGITNSRNSVANAKCKFKKIENETTKVLTGFITCIDSFGFIACAMWEKPETPPNILLILADDLGYSDIGCYGGDVATPNLDGLAANGVQFTHFYNTARSCPSRASILTGLHPHQAGLGTMVDNTTDAPGYLGELNNQCVTIAEVLRGAGYSTYMTGKWHVAHSQDGSDKHNWPVQRGFDHYYGLISGASSYFDPQMMAYDNDTLLQYSCRILSDRCHFRHYG